MLSHLSFFFIRAKQIEYVHKKYCFSPTDQSADSEWSIPTKSLFLSKSTHSFNFTTLITITTRFYLNIMGATSLKSAKSRGFTSYNIVRKDSSRGFWQFIDNQTSTEYLLKEVSQKEVPSLEQFVQKKAMLQHDNLVSIKGTMLM